MKKRTEELVARYQRGEDGTGEPRPMSEPLEFSGDILVGRSLRLPLAMFDELQALAAERGMPWSHIVREWIAEGLLAAREADGRLLDPVTELRRGLALVNHAAEQLAKRAA
jgi:predicted DNA-binding protein